MHFSKRGDKFDAWRCSTARKPEPHIVLVSPRKAHSENRIQSFYEDERLVSNDSLLKELDNADFIVLLSASLMKQNMQNSSDEPAEKKALNWDQLSTNNFEEA